MLRRLLKLLGVAVIASGLIIGGVVFDRVVLATYVPTSDVPRAARGEFALMAQAWNAIERLYVDRSVLQPERLGHGAIAGMVNALGDTGHSRFLTPDMLSSMRKMAAGRFEGVGIEVQVRNGHVVVVAPLDGSPAQRASLRPGDIIMRVDGQDVTGMPLDEVVRRIGGTRGTVVTLTILSRGGDQARDVVLKREPITIRNVLWHALPGTTLAHLRVAGFTEGVTRDLKQALLDIQREDRTGVVLDLRDNPGGLLSEAVGTASQFLRGGIVLQTRDEHGRSTSVPVEAGGVAPTIRIAVLVNNGTASGAEIVAGALKDAHRGVIIGETTFGTGTVLRPVPLSDGSALLLAVEEWLTPSGHAFWHKGIAPDIVVAAPRSAQPLFPEGERGMSAEELRSRADPQLRRAMEELGRGA